jgi:signal transduction histidine kinase
LQGLRRIAAHALKFHRDGNKPAEFKLNAVLREVSDFYSPQAKRQGICVHQRFETDGTILAFRGEIVQAVTNLVPNALDATAAGGQVILHLYLAPVWLCKAHSSLVIAFRSLIPIPGVVLRREIERESISLSSPPKGNEEQALDYG